MLNFKIYRPVEIDSINHSSWMERWLSPVQYETPDVLELWTQERPDGDTNLNLTVVWVVRKPNSAVSRWGWKTKSTSRLLWFCDLLVLIQSDWIRTSWWQSLSTTEDKYVSHAQCIVARHLSPTRALTSGSRQWATKRRDRPGRVAWDHAQCGLVGQIGDLAAWFLCEYSINPFVANNRWYVHAVFGVLYIHVIWLVAAYN